MWNYCRTSLFEEYKLCKQLLRVSGAVPDRDDSEEELTESEDEDQSEVDIPVKVFTLLLIMVSSIIH